MVPVRDVKPWTDAASRPDTDASCKRACASSASSTESSGVHVARRQVLVDPTVERERLLGRGEARRVHRDGRGSLEEAVRPGRPEVAEEDPSVRTQQEVAGLDVAVHALDDPGPLGRSFWLAAAADVIVASTERRCDLYDLAARRIHATFRVDLRERHDVVRVLAERILPVA